MIDHAKTRRGRPSINQVYSERECVLAGNFILARASRELARLNRSIITEILSHVVEDLVKGELTQIVSAVDPRARFGLYTKKTYLKTASLLARSCKSAALIADCTPSTADAAEGFGRHLGLCFQVGSLQSIAIIKGKYYASPDG